MSSFRFDAELWLHHGAAAWHFLTLPEDVSDDIADETEGQTRGFGSVRVRVAIGSTNWETSIFPSKQHAAYVMPVKRDVRDAEALSIGDVVSCTIELEPG